MGGGRDVGSYAAGHAAQCIYMRCDPFLWGVPQRVQNVCLFFL
jgi:hypothetical protein